MQPQGTVSTEVGTLALVLGVFGIGIFYSSDDLSNLLDVNDSAFTVASASQSTAALSSDVPDELTAEDGTFMGKSHAHMLNHTFYLLPKEAFHTPESATMIKMDWENKLLLDQGNVASLVEEARYENAISILKELRKQVDGSASCTADDDSVSPDYQEEILLVLDNFIGVLQIALDKAPLVECD